MIGYLFKPFTAKKLGHTKSGNSLDMWVAGLAKMPSDQL
jgi:hypothetical protein